MGLLDRLRQRIPDHVRERVRTFAVFLWKRYLEDRCFETAGVLAYASVFALVPLSAAVFGIFAAFPLFDAMNERMTHFLFSNFVPQAAHAVEAYLRQFADSATRLTSFGAIALLGSALLMMKSIEDAFNRIWRVAQPRPGMARFLVYWTALTLGPLLVVTSLALSSYLISLPLLGVAEAQALMPRLLNLVPMVVEFAAFTLAYTIIPHRRVQLRHAAAGGLLATALFELAKWGFGLYLKQVPSYEQIYGTLAVLPIFLIWLYLSWVVILLGASIAASLSAFRFQPRARRVPEGYELFAMLRLVGCLHAAQARGEAIATDALRRGEQGLSDDLLMRLLGTLQAASIVQRNERGDWLLARDLDQLDLGELIEACQLRIPFTPRPLPDCDDVLGARAAAAIEALRLPLRPLLAQPLSRILSAPLPPVEDD